MANVLVTGGAGYVGSICSAELLRAGHSVVIVDDLSAGFPEAVPPRATFYKADIGNPETMKSVLSQSKFDAVFHFAAKALVPESVTNPGIFFQQNVAAGIAFLETLRASGVRRFVFSSSAAVYGQPQSVPIAEEDAKHPRNAYGETKLMLERVLQWYASAYSWNVVAFRYFNAAGATDSAGERHEPETHIIPLLLATAAGERPFFTIYGSDYDTPDGTCVRDYVHVSDLAAAHILALKLPETSEIRAYNVGCGRAYSVREVIRTVEEVTGRKIPVQYGPRRLGDPAVLCASPAKLMRELNWKPLASDLRKIVQSAWNWKRSQAHRHFTPVSELIQQAG